MKQILQELRTGETILAEVPVPACRPGHVLIATERSLVSAGTERMLVDFGKAGWLQKARQQPDKVRDVIEKMRSDGVLSTMEAVQAKLDQLLPMGYCNVGRVIEVGAGVDRFTIGDRVVSNGHHAEIVCVGHNLCAKVPENVSSEAAAFTVLGAIALQGVRLAQPTLGETFVVTGLGLIGLIAAQLLRANGVRVFGVDPSPGRVAKARSLGIDALEIGGSGIDPVRAAREFSRSRGVDGVLITAATKSNEPVSQAAKMSRKRGRIILVGVAGLELSRADFYEKELSFQVSCSYGPGRYDPVYERDGHDYPVGFVRWTEQRNFEAVLDMMAAGSLNTSDLISHNFALADAGRAYAMLDDAVALGILLRYPPQDEGRRVGERTVESRPPSVSSGIGNTGRIGFVGAGNYASRTLIPAFQKAGAELHAVATSTGASTSSAARKFGFRVLTSDADTLFSSSDIDAIVIATPHNSHARYTISALKRGKHVFVEKPLCLNVDELAEIEEAHAAANCVLMVGFNRRFAPYVSEVRSRLSGGPISMNLTMNAGHIPFDHWTQNLQVGGGRVVGEACHYIDLARFMAGSPIVSANIVSMESRPGAADTYDTLTISLKFGDGSIAAIHYFANGSKAFPKERIEVFDGGTIYRIDNFRSLKTYGGSGPSLRRSLRQNKGQLACAAAFMAAVKEQAASPIPPSEVFEVSRWTVRLAELGRNGGGCLEMDGAS